MSGTQTLGSGDLTVAPTARRDPAHRRQTLRDGGTFTLRAPTAQRTARRPYAVGVTQRRASRSQRPTSGSFSLGARVSDISVGASAGSVRASSRRGTASRAVDFGIHVSQNSTPQRLPQIDRAGRAAASRTAGRRTRRSTSRARDTQSFWLAYPTSGGDLALTDPLGPGSSARPPSRASCAASTAPWAASR